MSSTAKAAKTWNGNAHSRPRVIQTPSKPLRLVRNEVLPLTEEALRPQEPAPQGDPLERPVANFCGLCGNKIEGTVISEHRSSGCNLKPQIWHYHQVCFKQLERMRRHDSDCWAESKPTNPETRYGAVDAASSYGESTASSFFGH
ncbi:MAG TPA: hypothetical protein VLV83_01310 [Acidobacteriota bacterium]|nr:hypothetical protein [Acidobacteriota bacterium]